MNRGAVGTIPESDSLWGSSRRLDLAADLIPRVVE